MGAGFLHCRRIIASPWRAAAGLIAAARTPIPSTLYRLAPGSYDLLLDGAVVGSVVRDVTRRTCQRVGRGAAERSSAPASAIHAGGAPVRFAGG